MTEFGHGGRPRMPDGKDLSGTLLRPEQGACIYLAHRIQGELERSDDAEATPTTAQGPEEIGLLLSVDSSGAAIRGHDVQGADAVAG